MAKKSDTPKGDDLPDTAPSGGTTGTSLSDSPPPASPDQPNAAPQDNSLTGMGVDPTEGDGKVDADGPVNDQVISGPKDTNSTKGDQPIVDVGSAAEAQKSATDPSSRPDPDEGYMGKGGYAAPATAAPNRELTGVDKLRAIVESYPSDTPNEQVLFGYGGYRVTVGDLREAFDIDLENPPEPKATPTYRLEP